MAVLATRNAPIASASTGNLTATYSQGTALDSNYQHIAIVKRLSATQPTTPSGWTFLGGDFTGTLGLWFYYKRGDSAVNSFTIATASVSTVILLVAYPTYDTVGVVMPTPPAKLAVAGISLPSGAVAATEAGMIALGFVGVSSTATSFSFTNLQTPTSGSGTTFAWSELQLTNNGDSAATTASWVTSRTAVLGVVLLRVLGPKSGGATGSVDIGPGVVAGSRPSKGGASGAVTLGNATVVGSRPSKGGATGAVAVGPGVVAGARASKGGATGAVTVGPGAVVGHADTIGGAAGSASGSVTVGPGVVVGSRPSRGAAAGAVDVGPGVVAGRKAARGAASGAVVTGPGAVIGLAPSAPLPSRLSIVALTPPSTLESGTPILTLEPR